jgi:hypothetical protein
VPVKRSFTALCGGAAACRRVVFGTVFRPIASLARIIHEPWFHPSLRMQALEFGHFGSSKHERKISLDK